MTIDLTTPDMTQEFNTYRELSRYLTACLCDECWKSLEHELPDEIMNNLSYKQWIDEMLMTQCGAEWFVEELGD